MQGLIEGFANQLREAVKISAQATLKPSVEVSNVVISGLGGSGIGGTIVSELAILNTPVPVQVLKSYFIPGFVNEKTLFIASSYSGNTEETISALEQAIKRGARIVCITSGGKIADMARAAGADLIIIPGGNPPRACLGYSLTQLLHVLHHYKIFSAEQSTSVLKAADLIEQKKTSIHASAKELASKMKGKLAVIYTTTFHEGVAIRWRQQLNENAKMLCWHHVVPEMNHNELVGWREKNENLFVIFLRSSDDYSRNNKRIEINRSIIANYTSNVVDVIAEGDNAVTQAIFLIHLGDWLSYYISVEKNIDPVEVKVIDYLKSELEKF